MNYFINHSTRDKDIISPLCKALEENAKEEDKTNIAFSSIAEKGTKGGDSLMPWINKNLEESDIFIAIITENYVRSQYCLYELNIALYLYSKEKIKKIIPICSNENIYLKVQNLLKDKGLIYINANAEDAYKKILNTFSWDSTNDNEQIASSLALDISKANSSELPYIGCSAEEYDRLIRYCVNQGIRRIQADKLSAAEIRSHLIKCDEIIILATTGIGVIRNLRETVLVDALIRGANIHVITANQWSDVCRDVATIEDREHDGTARIQPVAGEFDTVMGFLNEAYAEALRKAENKKLGTITCYSAYTLLRQTITLGRCEDGEAWSWLSITLPPKRTDINTPSLEIEGNIKNKSSLISTVYYHCKGIMEIAKSRNGYFEINDTFKAHPYYLEKTHAQTYWECKYQLAKNTMIDRREEFPDSYLIEVAAQHPLGDQNEPNIEFETRLKYAIRLYNELREKGKQVKIYIPGSRHQHNGRVDEISLSMAGKNYLTKNGILEKDILGEEANEKYKGADGVYNSADECYVASKIFNDGKYGYLLCICSPNQVARKSLFYYEFGVIAQCYSVPTLRMYHNLLTELFSTIPDILYTSHGWQEPDSEPFINSRLERRPKD